MAHIGVISYASFFLDQQNQEIHKSDTVGVGVVFLPIQPGSRWRLRWITGRSSPGRGSIFAMAKWVRWLIKPGPGRGIAYVDLKSAEFGIAAALSHDEAMKADYRSMLAGTIECVYFELAKRARQVPAEARVEDYKAIRSLWKIACLALMYGQSPEGLSFGTGISLSEARVIHSAFRQRYSTYWTWAAREIVHAHVRGYIETVCGWKMAVNDRTEDRTLLNYHCQATCGDVMRRAVALMADRGIAICEIVHDAVMVEGPVETLAETVEATKACWHEASLDVLGFELDVDAKERRSPEGYWEKDGEPMWRLLIELLEEAESRGDVNRQVAHCSVNAAASNFRTVGVGDFGVHPRNSWEMLSPALNF